ncbi:MAG: hypothetical protein WDO13_09865 [Verrucomicrobiota bacterium]
MHTDADLPAAGPEMRSAAWRISSAASPAARTGSGCGWGTPATAM